MDDRVVIALYRHGLTEENKRKAYLGWNDSPLCPESMALPVLQEYDRYFSSDLKRCVTTAKRLFPNARSILLKELREMDFGGWEGKTYEDLKDDVHYRQWLINPFQYSPPNGESFPAFLNRVEAGWKKIVYQISTSNIQRCAVITHAGVIRSILTAYAPESKDFWCWHIPHHTGFELIFTNDALRRGERCILLQEVPLTVKGHG